MTVLQKIFGFLLHGLLVANFHAYGFETDWLHLIYFYLNGRNRELKETLYTVHGEYFLDISRPLLGTLLFNISLCSL